jgi:hypothetical protein
LKHTNTEISVDGIRTKLERIVAAWRQMTVAAGN